MSFHDRERKTDFTVTQEAFERIAPGWYNYRHWSIFRSELESLAERWHGGSLLNIGCGHGPDFLPFKTAFQMYGIDFSGQMLDHARKYARKFDFDPALFLGDIRRLPFSESTFDHAIAVATYHHIDNPADRLSALNDLFRVLKPGGEAFITLWNYWQSKFRFRGKEPLVPWKIKDETVYRYYYLFSFPEAEKLVKKAGFLLLESRPEHSYRFPVKYFSRNICLLVKKPG
ncbi:MAG: class I SAM-dependent methyltransferase [Dehalococcoidales bacterium]|jgi:ubiquinone/menaquinone biosynthesis C-methylase UbiE|nr:class I SAM-dependent methyltransferase [Dehalococcoidales bacterium]